MSIMNSFINDIFEKIAGESSRLVTYNKRHTLSSRHVQTAVRRFFPGELAKHAVSEGTKAVTKFTSYGDTVSFKDGKVQYSGKLTAASDVDDVNSAISRAAGLQASVLEMAHAMHARLGNPPSLTAAVYLAATAEYIAAEIIELSGNSARYNESSWIQPGHVQLAMRNDAELNKMFQNDSMLDGVPDESDGRVVCKSRRTAIWTVMLSAYKAS